VSSATFTIVASSWTATTPTRTIPASFSRAGSRRSVVSAAAGLSVLTAGIERSS